MVSDQLIHHLDSYTVRNEQYRILCRLQADSLLSHVCVFKDVHVDEERLLVFTHPAQKQSSLLQEALGMENKGSRFTQPLKYKQLRSTIIDEN